jgi:hypothetical protein
MAKVTFLTMMHALRKPGERMILTYTRTGGRYFITPDIEVPKDIAERIKRHPQVRAGKDCLFPNMDQTWRWLPEATQE